MSLLLQSEYSPVIWIHSEEKYMPISIEKLLENSDLMKREDSDIKILTSPTEKDLEKYNTTDHFLNINEKIFTGEKPDKVPIYSHSYFIPDGQKFRGYVSSQEKKLAIIQYFFLYAYNAPKKICGFPCKPCLRGDHVYDLENLDLLLENEKILEVRFGTHRETDGVWKKYDDVEKTVIDNKEKIVAYCAEGSHGLYPSTGIKGVFPRIFFAANDRVNKGTFWYPTVKSFDDEKNFTWNDFVGGFESFNSGDSPKKHTYYNNSPQFSSNWFLRLFCPCFPI